MEFIKVETKDLIGIITFTNEAKRNALSSGLLIQLIDALDQFQKESLRVVILRANQGCKVWSAGHDISELPRGRQDPLGYDDCLEKALRKIKEFPLPIIAMIQGSVWGGACDLALSCDLIIGSSSCSFAITPVNIGIPYNISGVLQFVKRLPLNMAKEMFFTAGVVDAQKAEKIGILNHLVPENELEPFTFDMAKLICSKAPLSIALVKELTTLFSSSMALSPIEYERLSNLREQIYNSEDYLEGIRSFEEKRKPHFKGK